MGVRKAWTLKRVMGYGGLLYDRFLELPRNIKQSLLLAIDLLSIPLALWLAMALRLGHTSFEIGLPGLGTSVVTMLVTAVAFLRLGLYRAADPARARA